MKNLLFIAVGLSLLVSSCTKDVVTNLGGVKSNNEATRFVNFKPDVFNRIKQAIEERKQHKGVMLRNSTAPEKFTFGEMCEYLEALQNQQFSDFKSSSVAMEVDTLVFSLESRAEWSLEQLAELKEEVDSIFYASNYNSNGRNIDVVDVVYEETAPSRLEIYVSSSEGQSNNANWAFTTSSNCNFFAPRNPGWLNAFPSHLTTQPIVVSAYTNFLNSSSNPFLRVNFNNSSTFIRYVNIRTGVAEYHYNNQFKDYYNTGLNGVGPPLLWKLSTASVSPGPPIFGTWNNTDMNDWMCRMISFFQNVAIQNGEDLVNANVFFNYGCIDNQSIPFYFCGQSHGIQFTAGKAVQTRN